MRRVRQQKATRQLSSGTVGRDGGDEKEACVQSHLAGREGPLKVFTEQRRGLIRVLKGLVVQRDRMRGALEAWAGIRQGMLACAGAAGPLEGSGFQRGFGSG